MSEDRMQVDLKMEEYKMLREELNNELKAQDSLINICLTSVTAVLAFAFSQHLSLILFAAYPIIFFLLSMYLRHRERMMRISGYMIVYLEPFIGFTWETHGNIAYNTYNKGNKSIYKVFWKTRYYHFWGVLAIMTLLASLMIDGINISTSIPATSILTTVILYMVHIAAIICIYKSSFTLAKASNIRAEKVAYWRRVKENIKPDDCTAA